MIDHFASRVQATGTQAWICALFIHAGSRWRTFGTDDAFRSARRWRTEVTLETRAHGVILDAATLTVRSTG